MKLPALMYDDGHPPHPPGPPNLLEGDQKLGSMLGQFFLIPMLIAITAVGIFVGVRMMTGEDKDPVAMVREMRLQHGSARWQVAYDLNSRLVRDPAAREDARLVPELLAAFREMTPPRDQDEAMTRTYIVTILGILRKPEGLPVVIEAMTDRDGACQVAGIQAAGAIGDPAVVPQLVEFAGADDAGLRKAGVFALGLFSPRRREAEKLPALSKESHDAARAAIFKAHRDRVEDVRWNAALALARWGEGEAAGTLKTMLDRKHLENVGAEEATKMTEEMTVEVMVNAMKGALELKDESFRPLLEELRKGDRSMAVRQAAGTVLEAMGGRSS